MKTYRGSFFFTFEGKDYEAEVEAKYITDKNWGADADGKKGRPKDIIKDIIIEDVVDVFGNFIEPTKKMEEEIKDSVKEEIC